MGRQYHLLHEHELEQTPGGSAHYRSGSDGEALSAVPGARAPSLGWEDPLESEMAAHFSILAWKIPWTTEPSRLPSMGSQRGGHD